MPRVDILNRRDDILTWVSQNKPKYWIAAQLKCRMSTLSTYLKKMSINYIGCQSRKGKSSSNKLSPEEYSKCHCVNSTKMRLKLIEFKVKKEECEKCKNSEWLNHKIPLELHHVDGNKHNNNIENLKILCPNCHALEPNNSGKSNKRA